MWIPIGDSGVDSSKIVAIKFLQERNNFVTFYVLLNIKSLFGYEKIFFRISREEFEIMNEELRETF